MHSILRHKVDNFVLDGIKPSTTYTFKIKCEKNKSKNVVLEMLHIVQRIVDKYFILLLLCFYPKPVILLS